MQRPKAERGDYYEKKYKDYGDELKSNEPSLKEANSNYSNAGSFTINNVETDSSLVQEGDSKALLGSIQTEVTREFAGSAKDTASLDASKFYTQHSFAILHETDGQVDYSTTTANADGKTMIYVYFTRNIYTLKFHYYGKANYYGSSSSDHCVAINTNGYSYAGAGEIINDDDELNFGYNKGHTIVDSEGHTKTESNKWVAAKEEPSVPQTITIQAKYGADLREVWPVALPEESVTSTEGRPITMCSWATTDGKYREEAITAGSSHFDEPTIMGLYTTMDSYIIADPSEPAKTHHLVAYWSQYTVSVYRYNHCYELPDLKIDDSTDVKTVSLYSDSTDLKNTLYLVPTDNEAITKFDFTDLLKVSYDEASETITYDDIRGNYYAVRGYTSDGKTKYYAVSRQVETVSTNSIEKQNPSARPHMTRANNNADHTTEHQDSDGMSWQGNVCGTKENPYDLYFYYDRESYTIRYVVPNTNENDPQTEDELGRIELPYGAHVTSEEYAFQLDYRDNNQNAEYGWTYLEGSEAVPVCPDRNPDGKTPWKFKGWGLGPAGANMLWEMPDDSHPEETQAQISDDFYIGSDLLLYAIWRHRCFR